LKRTYVFTITIDRIIRYAYYILLLSRITLKYTLAIVRYL